MSGDEREETWLALTLPDPSSASLPLDATIWGAPAEETKAALPHISVGESVGGSPAALGKPGADLQVVGLLGEGGMGRVQVARQLSLEREVALKRPRPNSSKRDADLLRAEAVVTGHLEHPNIIPVHALGVDDDRKPLIVMKRVDGVCWRDLLRDPEHPGWARREPNRDARLVWHLQILAQLCNAIAFAHARGVVHRDMKPANVMVGEFGEVYLIDWGVAVRSGTASRTASGGPLLIGTPAYMAPEMASGGPLDARTDVYLLGATLHEILTDQVRHPGQDLHAVTLQALASAPFDYGPGVPDELASLANLATAREPARRPADALAFRQALLDHLLHRASLRLCAEADRALAAVEAEPANAPAGAIDECRFGYREALREWPDNPDALRGIRRCALATARLELARGNAPAARAALTALSDPPPELMDEVARLESAITADRAERERLRRLADDADPTIGIGARVLVLGFMVVVAGGVSLYAFHVQTTVGATGPGELLAYPTIIVSALLVVLAVFRRQIAANVFSRRLAVWFVALMLMIIANRLVGQSIGVSPPQQFTLDGVLCTGMLAAGAIFVFRWLWFCAAFTAGGSLIGIGFPDQAIYGFGAAAIAALVLGALMIRRAPGEN